MKGFLIAVAILGGTFYFLSGGNSSSGGAGKEFASATGQVVEITPSNADFMVSHSEAPVLAYFWAPW